MSGAILTAQGIGKRFGGVTALHDVDFELRAGEVHALVGENGAGKSTLVRILSGLLRPDDGELALRGETVSFSGPLAAQKAGVGIVAQELSLVAKLSVCENVLLGHEPRRRFGLLDWPAMRRRTGELLDTLGVRIDPKASTASLSIADQQLVEIAKALSRDPTVLIMDEPTAPLSESEVQQLGTVVNTLRDNGVGIVYVSHRLAEIFALADRITVLRDGELIVTQARGDVDEDELIAQMLGHELAEVEHVPQPVDADARPRLAVTDLTIPGVLSDVSLQVRGGEVLGIAGLVGSGRSELVRALFGLMSAGSGRVEVDGEVLRAREPREALAAGVFMLSEDRKAEGVLPDLSVRENLFLTASPDQSGPRFLLHGAAERAEYERVREFLDIRADSPEQPMPTLSGGNQQKVLLGRALASHAKVLLLNEPTRGVDVGAKADIYAALRSLAGEGAAIVVSSSDALELSQVCDRCLVMSRGRTARTLGPDELDADAIVAASVRGEDAG